MKDSSTKLKDRQDITPQNPTIALKKLIVTICLFQNNLIPTEEPKILWEET